MKKRELFDSFEQMEKLSQQMQRTIASVKEEMDRIVEQNAELAIENSHLRARLQELEERNNRKKGKTTKNGLSKSRQNLEKLYEEGFHVCTWTTCTDRGASMEPCVFCQDVIYGERH